MTFEDMLKKAMQDNVVINVLLPSLGGRRVRITNMQEDAVELKDEGSDNKYFVHYTSIVIVS